MYMEQSRTRWAIDRIVLDLTNTHHACQRQVGLGDCKISIIAQAPGQPRFGIHVSWIEDESKPYTIDEDMRAELESVYLCPVYFALAIKPDCSILRMEPLLQSKFLPIEPFENLEIQSLQDSKCVRPRPFMVLDAFESQGVAFQVILDKVDDQLRVKAHHVGTGPLNGFDLRLKTAAPMTLADAYKLPGIARLVNLARELIESGEVPAE
jgi:hypothetical protein